MKSCLLSPENFEKSRSCWSNWENVSVENLSPNKDVAPFFDVVTGSQMRSGVNFMRQCCLKHGDKSKSKYS